MCRENIIEIKEGSIVGENSRDVILFSGKYPHKDSDYVEELIIVIKSEEHGECTFNINVSGYNFKMVVGKFQDGHGEQILICGDTGGNNGYKIVLLYCYDNGELIELFDGEKYCEKYKCALKYLENYKVEVICKSREMRYILDIKNIDRSELRKIYDCDGKIATNSDPKISYIEEVNVIHSFEKEELCIELKERITPIKSKYILGCMRTKIGFKEDNEEILSQCICSKGESVGKCMRSALVKEDILEKLPRNAILSNLNKFGGNNGFITKDIDGDSKDEIICGYKLDGNQYLAIFRKEEEETILIDTFEGCGYDISHLYTEKMKAKSYMNIIIGWQVGAIWSTLDIIEFRNDKLNKLLNEDKINFSKMQIINGEGGKAQQKAVALWIHDSGEAYRTQIYTFRNEEFEKTNRYDKEYFKKVEEYYKKLITRTRETPQYLYFLIDAQIKIGSKKEAIDNLNKAIKHSRPYPSLEELKRIKKRICK